MGNDPRQPDAPTAVAVVGCGNPTRGDDGAGPAVIALLAGGRLARMAGVRLLDAGTDGIAALFAARGCGAFYLVDACRSGAEPGTVFEVPAGEFVTPPAAPGIGTHGLRWDHALAAGRRLFADAFPAEATVFLIEAQDAGFALTLSPPVSAAAARVAARIEALVIARLGDS